jgi:site-specific recombinase XerC
VEDAPTVGEGGGAGEGQTLHPHDLRHAFVTLSLDAGANLRDMQAAPDTLIREQRGGTTLHAHNLDRHPTYALAGLVA